MSDRHELFCTLALNRILFRNPRLSEHLLAVAGSAHALFAGDRDRWRSLFGRREAEWARFRRIDPVAIGEATQSELTRSGVQAIARDDPRYPALLRMIADPPALLYARGASLEALAAPIVALVGARRAEGWARTVASAIAQGLAERGIVVASGMAYGIDGAAHRGALAGAGETIAVLGCGVDIAYPPGHRRLADAIHNAGVLLSEFPPGTAPFPAHFPQRNRIISGMAHAVIVAQAAERSGSLITARCALEQGREVFAVPGPGGSAASRGTNALIRDGAALVEGAQEVVEMLSRALPAGGWEKRLGHFTDDMGKDSPLLRAIPARGAISVDALVQTTGQEAGAALAEITRLVLVGAVDELPGARYRRKGV